MGDRSTWVGGDDSDEERWDADDDVIGRVAQAPRAVARRGASATHHVAAGVDAATDFLVDHATHMVAQFGFEPVQAAVAAAGKATGAVVDVATAPVATGARVASSATDTTFGVLRRGADAVPAVAGGTVLRSTLGTAGTVTGAAVDTAGAVAASAPSGAVGASLGAADAGVAASGAALGTATAVADTATDAIPAAARVATHVTDLGATSDSGDDDDDDGDDGRN